MSPPSSAQLFVRSCFKKCTRCWQQQVNSTVDEPGEFGPRSKEWWYDNNNSPGMWYYNNFIQESMNYYLLGSDPPWCRSGFLSLGNSFITRELYPDTIITGTSTLHTGYFEEAADNNHYRARGYFSIDISSITDEDLYNSYGIYVFLHSFMSYIKPPDGSPVFIKVGFYLGTDAQPYFRYTWNTQPAPQILMTTCDITATGFFYPHGVILKDYYKATRQKGLNWFNVIMDYINFQPADMFLGTNTAADNYPISTYKLQAYLIY